MRRWEIRPTSRVLKFHFSTLWRILVGAKPFHLALSEHQHILVVVEESQEDKRMSMAASLKRYEGDNQLEKVARFANANSCTPPILFSSNDSNSDNLVVLSLLPAPTNHDGRSGASGEDRENVGPSASLIKKLKDQSTRIPAYGERDDWVPRTQEDYGDGGAFPEVQVAQFPLEMGRNAHRAQMNRKNALVPVTTDAQGRTIYDAVVRQGHDAGAVVHSRPSALVGRRYSEDEMERPDDESIANNVERTRAALQARLATTQIATNNSIANPDSQNGDTSRIVSYTAAHANSGGADASGASKYMIKMTEKKFDPLEPPKFRVQKSAQLDDGEPPVPVLQDAPKKHTKAEADAWDIPTPFSNWNSRGMTISLDKREMAAAALQQEETLSSKFATMAAALDAAQQSAREQVAYRARLEQQKQLQQREREDQEAKEVARLARMKRAGIFSEETDEEREQRMARDAVREDMRRDAEDESRRERMGSRAKSSAPVRASNSSGERDISERIALGQTVPQSQGEGLFDSRMFNQTAGLDHGFVNDEEYNLYDKPLLQTGREEALFRGLNQREGEVFQEEFSMDPSRKSRGARGPVEFERDEESAHQQRMEEIERQKSMAERQGRGERRPSPPGRRGGSDYPSPPRRRGERDDYPSPPRRGGDYPSPPRRRDSPPRASRAPADDPMDSMLSFMSDAKSASKKRDRDDGGRGPTLGLMHAVGGAGGSAEDYRDSKRTMVNFVPSREDASSRHQLDDDRRRSDRESEERYREGGRRQDDRDRRPRSPPRGGGGRYGDSRRENHDEFGRDRR